MSVTEKGSAWVVLAAVLLLPLLFSGCCNQETCAPVVNAWQDPDAMCSRYCVQKDDTIYSIAWAFDVDYRDLAKANHLVPPYHLKPGQTLSMRGAPADISVSAVEVSAQPSIVATMPEPCVRKDELVHRDVILPELNYQCKHCQEQIIESNLPPPDLSANVRAIRPTTKTGCWCWPACGKIVKEFSLQPGGCKGIEVAGQMGEPVVAIAPGKVVYSGSGLKGYGNLIIIKHSDNYLSAYAYNKKLLVKEGEVVKAGTEIGKMGQNDCGQVLLHFEIRQNGKPVNPLLYL